MIVGQNKWNKFSVAWSLILGLSHKEIDKSIFSLHPSVQLVHSAINIFMKAPVHVRYINFFPAIFPVFCLNVAHMQWKGLMFNYFIFWSSYTDTFWRYWQSRCYYLWNMMSLILSVNTLKKSNIVGQSLIIRTRIKWHDYRSMDIRDSTYQKYSQ